MSKEILDDRQNRYSSQTLLTESDKRDTLVVVFVFSWTPNMARAVIALILILDVLYCPFACSGSIRSLATAGVADSCCSPTQTDSDDDSPQQSDVGCDGSCKNCLCGGAINGDETCADHLLAQDTLSHVWLSVLPIEVSVSTPASSQQILCDDSPAFPSGVTLRALLQSYLL